ncbi:MAG: homoserine dehydrogenase [Nitrososphaeria archaeon]
MKIQLIGLGNVGKNLLKLLSEEEGKLKDRGLDLRFVSISDSKGTAINENGLELSEVLKYKELEWRNCTYYFKGYSAIDAIKNISSDIVVELTPSTINGEPGLSHIKEAFTHKKHVVTANKGPLVVSFKKLKDMALENNLYFLYEATVAAHVPIFCLLSSCFITDEILKVEGIFNATTNFIICEMEQGFSFQEALDKAIKAGWAETNYADDVDGIDAARKVVILANTIYDSDFKLDDVKIEGIRNVEPLIMEAKKQGKRVKLLCEIAKEGSGNVFLQVSPKVISQDNPFSTVNYGDMAVKFYFKNSQEIFVSAKFVSPRQTAQAVLNDIIKVALNKKCQG